MKKRAKLSGKIPMTTMTPAQQAKARIKILKDVKKQLKVLNFCRGTYLGGVIKNFNPRSNNLQKSLPKIKKHCKVCAIGALFIGLVDVFNEIEIDVAYYNNDYVFSIDNSFMEDKLTDYFSYDQLELIEGAFESWGPGCQRFHSINNSRERFEAIINNMLENGGRFVP